MWYRLDAVVNMLMYFLSIQATMLLEIIQYHRCKRPKRSRNRSWWGTLTCGTITRSLASSASRWSRDTRPKLSSMPGYGPSPIRTTRGHRRRQFPLNRWRKLASSTRVLTTTLPSIHLERQISYLYAFLSLQALATARGASTVTEGSRIGSRGTIRGRSMPDGFPSVTTLSSIKVINSSWIRGRNFRPPLPIRLAALLFFRRLCLLPLWNRENICSCARVAMVTYTLAMYGY